VKRLKRTCLNAIPLCLTLSLLIMKKHVLTLSVIFGGLWIILSSNASGAGADQGTDRTGSPLSGESFCGDCHGANAFRPTIEIAVLDGATAIQSYTPGRTYTMRVTIAATTGTPNGYGFQAVSLNNANANAGTFGTPPAGMRTIDLGGRRYIEHTRRSTSNIFSIPWTAPARGAGRVRVFAAGIAANGSGSSGDGAVKGELALSESGSTSLPEFARLKVEVDVFPNPATDFVQVRLKGTERPRNLFVDLVDAQGRQLQRQVLPEQVELDLRALSAGTYFLRISDGQKVATQTLSVK
jgi:hypothetical protein